MPQSKILLLIEGGWEGLTNLSAGRQCELFIAVQVLNVVGKSEFTELPIPISTTELGLQQWIAQGGSRLDYDWALLVPAGYQLVMKNWLSSQDLIASVTQLGRARLFDCLGMAKERTVLVTKNRLSELIDAEVGVNTAAASTFLGSIELAPINDGQPERQWASKILASGHAETDQLNVARAFEILGDDANALSWHAIVAQDDSLERSARWLSAYRSASILERRGDYGEAVNWAQIAYEFWPERNEALVLLAKLLRLNGEARRAKKLLDLAQGQALVAPHVLHMPADYGQNIYAELVHCEYQLGNYYQVLESANRYTQYAFGRGGAHQILLNIRDEAFRQWQQCQSVFLPSNSARKNRFLIVVPFYNAALYLQNCVDSIAAQTYRHYEVVLVDDHSDDNGIEQLDLSGLSGCRVIRNQSRRGALANQVSVLSEHGNGEDIAVFVDGDDRLAHPGVLEFLNNLYLQSQCWVSYGQARMSGSGNLGFARPILPEENIADLFASTPMMFPIHLRTHRVGLFHALLDQDPNLTCLKNSDHEFIEHASDTAHMRAMFMLAGTLRVMFVPDVLYEYNMENPLSHFKSASGGLMSDAKQIAQLPVLNEVYGFKTSGQSGANKLGSNAADLVVAFLEGGDINIINDLLARGELPTIARLLPHQRRVSMPAGYSNDVFWRGVFSGQSPGQTAAQFRSVLDLNGYGTRSCFDTPALATVAGFWDQLAYNGHRVAILNPSDVSMMQSIPGLTSLSSWLTHAPLDITRSQPASLLENLEHRFDFADMQKSLDSGEVVGSGGVPEFLQKLHRRGKLKAKIYSSLLKQGNWNLFAFGLDATHDALHKLWHFHDLSSPLYTELPFNPVEESYRQVDHCLKEILAAAGQTNVALVCGLGGQMMSSLNSILDEVLHLIELAIRGTSVGRKHSERWFFALSAAPRSGAIRFNIQGRDAQGQIAPDQVSDVQGQLTSALMDLTTKESGLPVVAGIHPLSAQCNGPFAHRMPDLLVEWAQIDSREPIHSPLINSVHLDQAKRNLLDYRTGDHSDFAAMLFNDHFRHTVELPDSIEYTDLAALFNNVIDRASAHMPIENNPGIVTSPNVRTKQ